jgi:hypothetical protein
MIAASPELSRTLNAKQRLLAHLPMALDRRLARTLNVGLASGATVASLATYPSVTHLDVVEINAPVERAAALFESSRVLADPRTRLAIDDAVHYLLRAPERYDLIVSDGKQNEDFSGNAKILSREFYEVSLARLSECGIFIQWILGDTYQESFRIVLRTFLSVFPEVEIFVDPPGHVFMLGSRCPIYGRPRLGDEEFRSLPVAQELAGVGYHAPADLAASWVASGAAIAAKLPPGPLNENDKMPIEYLSYRAPRNDAEPSYVANMKLLLEAGQSGVSAARDDLAPPDSPPVRRLHTLTSSVLQALDGDPRGAVRELNALLAEYPNDPTVLELVGQLRARASKPH